jgi:hypothetical protein
VKSAEEIMEILEAFDLTGSYRPPPSWLAAIIAPSPAIPPPARPPGSPPTQAILFELHRAKLEEWMDRSRSKPRADVAHNKLVVLGYQVGAHHWAVVAAA